MSAAFTPLQIGPLRLRNRFIKSATNEGMAPAGVPSKMWVEHHRRIAAGGAAMTTVAYCAVSADGRTFVDQIQMTRACLPHLRALTEAVHAQGAAACAQITHGGAFSFVPHLSTRYPLSASAGFNPPGLIAGRWFKSQMTIPQGEIIAQAFVDAALLAREAGFDAVEIHMGHGYLLSQFLSPAYNCRRDVYGGNASQRATFPALVLQRVLAAVGQTLAVICKINVADGFKGGAEVGDAIAVAQVLERTGAHLLVLSGGMNVEAPWAIFGSPLPAAAIDSIANPLVKTASKIMRLWQPKPQFLPLYFLSMSQQVRAAVRMPLAYVGGAQSLDAAEQLLAAGFDGIAMGRALLHDANIITHWQQGRQRVSGCTACNQCIAQMYTPGGTRCVLGPPNDAALCQAAAG